MPARNAPNTTGVPHFPPTRRVGGPSSARTPVRTAGSGIRLRRPGPIAARPARRAREELARRDTITEAVDGSGCNSWGRFYAPVAGLLGMTPRQFRAGGRGATIRFAVGQCWLGAILAAASERGICAIEFGDNPDGLVRAVQDRFPKAQLIGGDHDFERLVARVVGLVEAPAKAVNGTDLPLGIRAP